MIPPEMDAIIRGILDRDRNADILFLDTSARVVAREVLINRLLQGRSANERGGGRVRFVPQVSTNELDGLTAAVAVVLDVSPQYGPASYAVATETFSLGTPVVTLLEPFADDAGAGVGHNSGTHDRQHYRSNVVAALYKEMGMSGDAGDDPENETCCIARTPEKYIDLAVRLASPANVQWRESVRQTIFRNSGPLFEDEAVVTDFDKFLRRVGTSAVQMRKAVTRAAKKGGKAPERY